MPLSFVTYHGKWYSFPKFCNLRIISVLNDYARLPKRHNSKQILESLSILIEIDGFDLNPRGHRCRFLNLCNIYIPTISHAQKKTKHFLYVDDLSITAQGETFEQAGKILSLTILVTIWSLTQTKRCNANAQKYRYLNITDKCRCGEMRDTNYRL